MTAPPWARVCRSFEEEAAADREYWAEFTPDERVALWPAASNTFPSTT
jgi:hypothetical protein